MQLKADELEFLSAWAREEKSPDPYVLPAHQLQAAHQVRGVTLIRAIKAWAHAEGRRDEDIFQLYDNLNPSWPWSSGEDLRRLTGDAEGINRERKHKDKPAGDDTAQEPGRVERPG
ncbi:MAG TPA: hypothetical protein VEL76_37165 [Gemmataceae bacterium]|nr:hypothetical protein [Gemmataceae bacterium]